MIQPNEYDQRMAAIKADMRARDRERACGQPSKQWGGSRPCRLDKGHRGYHSISVFVCDQCGHYRRAPWASHGTDSNGETDVVLCFPCVARNRRPGWDW
jgi:hypothetical protein